MELEIHLLRPSGWEAIISLICATSKAFHSSRSSCSDRGSKFSLEEIIFVFYRRFQRMFSVKKKKKKNKCIKYLMVPLNMITSWGIAESLERRISRGTWRTSVPSIDIRPWVISNSRNSAITVDDLPLPVLPQIPICEKYLWKPRIL